MVIIHNFSERSCKYKIIVIEYFAVNYYAGVFEHYISELHSESADNNGKGLVRMRIRKQELGDRNIIGEKVEQQRKSMGMKQKDLLTQLQIKGIDLNASGLSKLEGQLRYVTDFELKALADVLGVSVNWLLGLE